MTTPAPSPTVSSAPAITPSPRLGVADLPLQFSSIASEYTRQLDWLQSLGTEIVWSAGRSGNDAGDVYRYVLGRSEPELVFLNLRRGMWVTRIAGSSAGYAFAEEKPRRDIDEYAHDWWVWFLPATPRTEPILLDQSDDVHTITPPLAMANDHIAWVAVHGSGRSQHVDLRVVNVGRPDAVETVLSYPEATTSILFPSLWRDELWYGISENNWDTETAQPRVEMLDLAHLSAPPQAFGTDQRAFMPVANDDVVVWKSGGDDTMNPVNSGMLTVYWRATGITETLPIPGRPLAADRVSYPSVGDRFVAWWDDIHQRFYLFDLKQHEFRRVAEYDWTGEEGYIYQSLAGNLLAAVHHTDGHLTVEWARLPD